MASSVYLEPQAEGSPAIDFCTLGMFIIGMSSAAFPVLDSNALFIKCATVKHEIYYQPPTPPVKDIIGGAGAYSAVGARIFSSPPQSRSVGWIVDAGSDFPPEIRDIIRGWDTACVLRETPERLTTRGWNGYDKDEKRAFKYLTPKIRLDHDSLPPSHLRSKSFHLICSPTRCISLVENILSLREKLHGPTKPLERPLFIWEPVPDLCTPEELQNCLEALRLVDVVSPNHAEFDAFFTLGPVDGDSGEVKPARIAHRCQEWLAWGIGPHRNGAIVIRAGKVGCYIASPRGAKWLPPYHQPSVPDGGNSKVVDPTGGGNGFLGGLAVGLVRGGPQPGLQNLEEAAIWGSVAASFAIEQVGMPTFVQDTEGETWNGVRVEDRLDEFKKRLETYVQPGP
ncbi:MAG: hypothetical protein M1819_004691 [Sarea resinae]|nr:MAG: hypothetical protein M1819_004691 [Sarea resinae]